VNKDIQKPDTEHRSTVT